ncbi:MAG TPA: hypothetical protein VFY87_17105 [Geminicoccaceae bacterium]|nr:hypothetical protein [Geminicoccaceae bacterium]
MATATRPNYPRDDGYPAADDRYRLTAPAAVRRISWGAIFAGIAVVLVVQLLLMLLGLAIGTATIDPTAGGAGTPDASTLGIGGAVWWLVSTAISVFAGAWVAGRLAGMPTPIDGMLHGIVTWAAATLLAFYLLTTTVGTLVSGAFGTLGTVAQTIGQGGQSLVQGAMQVLPDDVRSQAEGLFERAPAAAGQVQQEAQEARQAAGGGSTVDAVQRVVRGVQEGAAPQDREAAINVIAQQAGIPPQEAEQRLDQFQQTYQQYTQQAAEQARQAAEATANTVSQVSFWSVVALVVGLVLAAIGGRAGTPRDLRAPV